MRRVVLAAVLSFSLCSSANAQSWTGAFVGVGAGYSPWANLYDYILPSQYPMGIPYSTRRERLISRGPLLGVRAGYDWQVGRAVIGVVGDVDHTLIRRHYVRYLAAPSSVNISFKDDQALNATAAASLRIRAGALIGVNTLVYATGGFALVQLQRVIDASSEKVFTQSWHIAAVGGAGIEHRLTPNWSIFGEYRFTTARAADVQYYGRIGYRAHDARTGISYRF